MSGRIQCVKLRVIKCVRIKQSKSGTEETTKEKVREGEMKTKGYNVGVMAAWLSHSMGRKKPQKPILPHRFADYLLATGAYGR